MAETSSEYTYSQMKRESRSRKTWKQVTVGPRQFIIRGPLGKGGFSEVYAGEDSETGKRVALKMMFDVQSDETTYKQTCDEIKMMRKLNHRNLIKLLGYDLHAVYRERKCVILVQEIAPNRELFEYLLHSKTPFSEQLVMYIGTQIFTAIKCMHSQGIAHRDLKPENILLDKEFNLKIADFGFAKFFRKSNQSIKMRTELGTRGYMAPEISANSHIRRQDRKSYDEKVDIFALGVIMFICFAGFPPFRQTNGEDWWFDKIMKKEWNYFWKAHERKAKFSVLAKQLLQKMLAAKSEDRFNIQECLKSDFLVNNGKAMEKAEYTEHMKARYQHVKRAIKAAKANKASAGKRDIKSALQDESIRKQLDAFKDFVPAPFLCQNDIRLAVYNAPEEDVVKECAKACAKSIEGLEDNPKQWHGFVQDMTNVLNEFEADELKNVFSNATEEEDFSFLPEHVDQKNLLKTLNKCIIGDDVPVPIDGDNSLAQYLAFDDGENLDLYDPEELENAPNVFHVRFGLGTFIHLIRQFATNIDTSEVKQIENGKQTITFSGVSFDDFESGTAVVQYDITEEGVVDGEGYELSEPMSVELKLWKLLPIYEKVSQGDEERFEETTDDVGVTVNEGERFEVVEVPGFALTVREVKDSEALSMFAGDTTQYVMEKILHDSELVELLHKE